MQIPNSKLADCKSARIQEKCTFAQTKEALDALARTIENDKTHFAVLAIGATAKDMGIDTQELYNRLKRVGLIRSLLLDCYDTLHSESIEGVVWNVEEALKNWEGTTLQ